MSPRRTIPPPPRDDGAPPIPTLEGPRYSQSLERGLEILACFTPERPVQGIADIADELGMSRSTTHRYAITLVALGFMEQVVGRKYRLAMRVTGLGMSALSSTGLREHAQPYLEELRQRTGYTTSLAVLDGAEIVYVDRVRSFRRGQAEIDLDIQIDSRLPAHCTALGKVLLAGLPVAELRELIAASDLRKSGPNTIVSKRALLSELDHVREEGVAVDDEETTAGLVAVAAPVRDECREVVAAVSLAAPTRTIALPDLVDRLQPHLLATADRISARLGYRRDDEAVR